MIRMITLTVIATVALASLAAAQKTQPDSVTKGIPTSGHGTTATTPETTMAPVAVGSSDMHQVPTPTAPARTTLTGGNTNGGSN